MMNVYGWVDMIRWEWEFDLADMHTRTAHDVVPLSVTRCAYSSVGRCCS